MCADSPPPCCWPPWPGCQGWRGWSGSGWCWAPWWPRAPGWPQTRPRPPPRQGGIWTAAWPAWLIWASLCSGCLCWSPRNILKHFRLKLCKRPSSGRPLSPSFARARETRPPSSIFCRQESHSRDHWGSAVRISSSASPEILIQKFKSKLTIYKPEEDAELSKEVQWWFWNYT